MKKPKIIIWDLETLTDLNAIMERIPRLYDFSTLKTPVSTIICFGYKELDSNKVHCISAWDFKEWKKDINNDYNVVKAAYDILIKCDAHVTHNGKNFDIPLLQSRLLYWGLPTLPKIPAIDTCWIARKKLYLFSNKLEDLCKFLKVKGKLKHEGWDLWVKVSKRQKPSQNKMFRYCKRDVLALESAFKKLRRFVSNLPNYNIYKAIKKPKFCSNCGSSKIHSEGTRQTKTKINNRYRCYDCGSWSFTPSPKAVLRSE